MRRTSLYLVMLFITFMCGLAATRLVHIFFPPKDRAVVETNAIQVRRFVSTSSLLEPDYHIYWYRTPSSKDHQEITLFGDLRSAEVTRELFHSNATTDYATLIERGPKLDLTGRKIGKRGVTRSREKAQTVRIFWTEGDIFWFVQAPTLELAREFEASEIVRSITTSNKDLYRPNR